MRLDDCFVPALAAGIQACMSTLVGLPGDNAGMPTCPESQPARQALLYTLVRHCRMARTWACMTLLSLGRELAAPTCQEPTQQAQDHGTCAELVRISLAADCYSLTACCSFPHMGCPQSPCQRGVCFRRFSESTPDPSSAPLDLKIGFPAFV